MAGKIRNFWHKLSRGLQITILVLVVLLIAIRIALPFIVRDYVNRTLSHIQDYRGHVDKIRINLWRGAYTIENLKVVKTNANIPVPFVSMREMDLSVQWSELFRGSLVGKVTVNDAQLNFVNGPTEKEQQTGAGKDWQKKLEDLFPIDLNKFQINNGDIRFRDFDKEPKVDIYITNLFATATNLTNKRPGRGELPAGLIARGSTIGRGQFSLELHMNPLAKSPTFKLDAAITNMDLRALNSFMRAYGKFDVEKGTAHIFTEVAAADGRYEGYVKPLFEDLDIFAWEKERKKNVLQIFWEAIVAGVAHAFKNQPHNRLATVVPISGTFEKGNNVDLWTTIGGVLRNAFIRVIVPRIDQSVDIKDVEQKANSPNK
jgi:hypothetical protein